jgi:fatty-acyl-CoA synthase
MCTVIGWSGDSGWRSAPSEAELMEFLGPKVARYKLPRRFLFWPELPKSGYGKIPKRLVKDEILARGWP